MRPRLVRRAIPLILSILIPGLRGPAGAEVADTDVLKGLRVHEDRRHRETSIQPAYDSWTLYDYRVYPILRRDARGTKSLLLNVTSQGDARIGMKSLQVIVDGTPHVLTPKRSELKVDAYGCRVTETALIEGQDELIRTIATGREVGIDIVATAGPRSFRLTPEEIGGFVRLVAVHDAEALPEPERPVPDEDRGREGLTSPQIIRESKVTPEFPVMARGRMATGKVTLHAVVHSDGTTEVLEVRKSSARYCGFEQAAIEAVRQWRYIPGQLDGKPTDIYFTVDIDFFWK